jgi:hypothetical protein
LSRFRVTKEVDRGVRFRGLTLLRIASTTRRFARVPGQSRRWSHGWRVAMIPPRSNRGVLVSSRLNLSLPFVTRGCLHLRRWCQCQTTASLIPLVVGGDDHAGSHLLCWLALRDRGSGWRSCRPDQRGGLPRVSMERAQGVPADAFCRPICSGRSPGSAPHQPNTNQSSGITKRGGRPLPPLALDSLAEPIFKAQPRFFQGGGEFDRTVAGVSLPVDPCVPRIRPIGGTCLTLIGKKLPLESRSVIEQLGCSRPA